MALPVSAPDFAYDRLVALAARLLRVPMAAVTLVDDPLSTPIAADVRWHAEAPIRDADGATVGTLAVSDTVAREPSPDELDTLRTLADAIGAHLELARQLRLADVRAAELAEHQRERRAEADSLALLAEVTSRLAAGGLGDDALADAICVAACRIAGADHAVLYAPHPDGGLGAAGASAEELHGLHIADDATSLTLEAFRSGTPCFAGDAASQGWPMAARHGARSLVAQPVRVDDMTIGVLSVFWREPRQALGARVGRLVGLLAHEAATAFARSALFAHLAQQSRTDALTGVLNRRALDEELESALQRAAHDGGPVTVAVLDLDHFKAYNDTHGHPAGDALLKAWCAAWSAALRADDVLARLGGEEFVVVLPGCALPDARTLTDRLRRQAPAGETCSAGIAAWDGTEGATELLARADRALYRAKAQGRDAVRAG